MKLEFLKNTKKYFWTEHAKYKMKYYNLGTQKILGVIRCPKRKEKGVAKNTIAVMQPVSPKIVKNKSVWKQEVWVMYQTKIKNENAKIKITNQNPKFKNARQIKIISAWRYPGISPKKNPIPKNIFEEISDII